MFLWFSQLQPSIYTCFPILMFHQICRNEQTIVDLYMFFWVGDFSLILFCHVGFPIIFFQPVFPMKSPAQKPCIVWGANSPRAAAGHRPEARAAAAVDLLPWVGGELWQHHVPWRHESLFVGGLTMFKDGGFDMGSVDFDGMVRRKNEGISIYWINMDDAVDCDIKWDDWLVW